MVKSYRSYDDRRKRDKYSDYDDDSRDDRRGIKMRRRYDDDDSKNVFVLQCILVKYKERNYK